MLQSKGLVGRIALATAVTIAAGVSATGAFAQDTIDVRFSWKLKGEYGFLYHAQNAGMFEEHNLEVNLGEGAGSQAALGSLIQGQEDVVIMPGIFAISAIQQGMPVKLIALYQPAAPIVMISHGDNPITEPDDLEGKRVAHSVGETGTSYLGVFCAVNEIDCGAIDLVQMDSGARVPQFLQGQVDAVSVYLTNDLPILEESTGEEFPTLDLAEYGLHVPGLAAVASVDGIENNAGALSRFLDATAEAIEATEADPAAATASLLTAWDGAPDDAVVQEQVEATTASFQTVEGHPVGWIEESAVSEALELLESQDDIGDPRPVSDFYTNELLTE